MEEDRKLCDTASPVSSVVSDNESSDEDNVLTDSMTSHTIASDASEIKSSCLSDESLKPNKVQDLTQDISILNSTLESITESQFSSSMPYLEG